MSFEETNSQQMVIQGQGVRVDITLKDFSAKKIRYEFVSPDDLHPMTVALAMLCIVQTIFIDHDHDIAQVLGIRNTDKFEDAKIQ